MPAPELLDATPSLWHHISELKVVIGAAIAFGLMWGRMEMGMMSLRREHKALKELVDTKTDKTVCEIVHAGNREAMDLVVKTIEAGNKHIRQDIRHMSDRLDVHIQQNGKK